MEELSQISQKIKTLKDAKEILHYEYTQTEYHKKKEADAHEYVPPSPEDEEIFKLLTAIQQLDFYIKKFQSDQFTILKENAGE